MKQLAPLQAKKQRRSRTLPPHVDIDPLGTETWGNFPIPLSTIVVACREPDGEWDRVEVSPQEFNPLSLAMGMFVGEIKMSPSTLAQLCDECGYVFNLTESASLIN